MTAVLRITADPADVRRAFGAMVGEARNANRQLAALARQGSQERTRIERDEINQARRDLATMQRDRIRAANERIRSEREAARARERMEKDVTKRAEAEARSRGRTSAAEARETERNARRMLAIREASERQATRAAERESRKRIQDEEKEARRIAAIRIRYARHEYAQEQRQGVANQRASGRRMRGVLGAVAAVGSVARAGREFGEEVMSAQERYGNIEQRLNDAFFQTTGDNREIADRRSQMLSFAQARNLNFEEVADAAAYAQERTSALGSRGESRGTRDERMRSFMANIGEAADLRQDMGDYSVLAGSLAGSGLQQGAQREVMRSIAGMSMQGAIEPGNLSREALRPMIAAVAQATGRLGPGATPGQISSAVHESVLQEVAAMQILAPRGITALRGGNAINATNASLTSDRTQQSVLAHVRNRFGENSALERELFERDAQGRSHLKRNFQDVYSFGETLSHSLGDNPEALRNFLGTETDRNGHVLRQSLLSPQRDVIAALAGLGEDGKTGWQLMRELRQGSTITDRDVEQGRQLREGEIGTRNTHQKQEELLGMLSHPGAIRYSENEQAFGAEHPFIARLLGMMPGGSGDILRSGFVGAKTGAEAIAAVNSPRGPGELQRTDHNGLPVSLSQNSVELLSQAIASAIKHVNIEPGPGTIAHIRTSAGASGGGRPPEAGR